MIQNQPPDHHWIRWFILSVLIIIVAGVISRYIPTNLSCGPNPTPIYRHLQPGETASVGEQDFVVGDICINGIFEGITNNALIVDFRIPATVMAPYGADIVTVSNLSDKNVLIQQRAVAEKAANSNVTRVNIIIFNGNQTLPRH